jgi:hypothetical protein
MINKKTYLTINDMLYFISYSNSDQSLENQQLDRSIAHLT